MLESDTGSLASGWRKERAVVKDVSVPLLSQVEGNFLVS
jgi:hypothetical protein